MQHDLPIPLSLYIHIPWCVKKCPYCDFNSHTAKGTLPEDLYIRALMDELVFYRPYVLGRNIESIFFGGGTPSLFSGKAIAAILAGVSRELTLGKHCEITLEANPGTIDYARFSDFRAAGITRLSLGVQSFASDKLQQLGRIHDGVQAKNALNIAKKAGFVNFNIDLMYGLPTQTLQQALTDLNTALDFAPPHLSWYQLTIEPNTLFHHHTPLLPHEDSLWEMQEAGIQCLEAAGLRQYEVSAYAPCQQQCLHNRNYWEFGDYIGIGAGAHSKLTVQDKSAVVRLQQVKHPTDYLLKAKREQIAVKKVSADELLFEFMLNVLRLSDGVPYTLFSERTGLPRAKMAATVALAAKRGFITQDKVQLVPTQLGKQYLNDLTAMFFL